MTFFIQRDEWMTVDFMSVKTVSSSSLKAEKETKKKIEQAKTQALEQVRYLKCFNFLICLNKPIKYLYECSFTLRYYFFVVFYKKLVVTTVNYKFF